MAEVRKFFCECEPRGQGRPRFDSRGKFAYKARKDKEYENAIAVAYADAYPGMKPLCGPMEAKIKIFFKIPKSFTKAKKNKALDGVLKPTKRSDIDNCVKSIFDALNGIAYMDDKDFVKLIASKCYAEVPGVEVEISTLDEEGANSPK